MNKHTPVPWHIIGGYNIYSELGGQSGDGATADARDGWHIASIGEAPTSVDGESVYLGRGVQKANARLIVAAPDLLEALEAAIDCEMVPKSSALEGGAVSYSRQVVVADMIRAAISRARGEA
jgi:hypothetical protein